MDEIINRQESLGEIVRKSVKARLLEDPAILEDMGREAILNVVENAA